MGKLICVSEKRVIDKLLAVPLRKMGKLGACPDCCCEWELDASVELHEVVSCPDCGANLEVVALSLDVRLAAAEDWRE